MTGMEKMYWTCPGIRLGHMGGSAAVLGSALAIGGLKPSNVECGIGHARAQHYADVCAHELIGG